MQQVYITKSNKKLKSQNGIAWINEINFPICTCCKQYFNYFFSLSLTTRARSCFSFQSQHKFLAMKLYGLTWARLENAINFFLFSSLSSEWCTFCVICITHDLHARLIDITLWSMLHNSPWHGGKVFPNKTREMNVDLQREITMWLH